MEIKTIKSCPSYRIDEDGNIFKKDGKKMKPIYRGNSYRVSLYTNGKQKPYYVSRLVAEAFLEGYTFSKPGYRINYKDGDTMNLNYKNLEWIPDRDITKEKVIKYQEDGKDKEIIETSFIDEKVFNKWKEDDKVKEIPTSPGYYIHRGGFVINSRTLRVMKTRINGQGYLDLNLPSNREGKRSETVNLHRHVAKAFVKKPDDLNEGTVNHIDGKKLNNNYTNLEWISTADNIRHAHEIGLHSRDNPVYVYDTKLDDEVKYATIVDAAKHTKLSRDKLTQLIKISQKYPIFGRYKVRLHDEEKFLNNTNYASKDVYVYDHIQEKEIKLKAVNKITYLYGIGAKTLERIAKSGGGYIHGVSVSFNQGYKDETITKEKAIADREKFEKRSILG